MSLPFVFQAPQIAGQDDSVGDVDIAAYRDVPENDLSKR
jgi:hypothetical protein